MVAEEMELPAALSIVLPQHARASQRAIARPQRLEHQHDGRVLLLYFGLGRVKLPRRCGAVLDGVDHAVGVAVGPFRQALGRGPIHARRPGGAPPRSARLAGRCRRSPSGPRGPGRSRSGRRSPPSAASRARQPDSPHVAGVALGRTRFGPRVTLWTTRTPGLCWPVPCESAVQRFHRPSEWLRSLS
jgi:hypothetical protein